MIHKWLFVLLVISALDVQAERYNYPFDKVFTTQEQRNILDRIRKEGRFDQQEVIVADTPASIVPKTEAFKVSGIVIRDDGQHQVWVNGKSELSSDSIKQNLTVGEPRKATKSVPLQASDKFQSLKPGQTWIVQSNKVIENYRLGGERDLMRLPKAEQKTHKNEEPLVTDK